MAAEAHATVPEAPARGWVRWVARPAWVLLVALQLASFLPLLPHYLPLADHPCPQSCLLTVQGAHALASAGIAPRVYIWIVLVVTILDLLVSLTLAAILFVRRSHDIMALLAGYFMVVLPTGFNWNLLPMGRHGLLLFALSMPAALELVLTVAQGTAFYAIFLLFPSGRFVPRGSWPLLIVAPIWGWMVAEFALPGGVVGAGFLFLFASGIGCMVYRYRRVSTPSVRQQTKWICFGVALFILTQTTYFSSSAPLGATVYPPLAYLVYQVGLPMLPITFFLAMQRYRLYDIDTLISRALVYGALTAIVVTLYVVGVVGSQAVVRGLTGHALGDSPPALVVTTLVVAALFTPLRRRLQDVVDRTFYRRHYDAGQTLRAFSTSLHTEMDLESLRAQVIAVVRETMHPAVVSLWLREDPPRAHESVHA
ncbi:MAG TPA: hypothetical protein VGR57_12870 [Ktedonobacterales bacterium]|nr:hypothetical protein [Ktedonobacterales bacterium]